MKKNIKNKLNFQKKLSQNLLLNNFEAMRYYKDKRHMSNFAMHQMFKEIAFIFNEEIESDSNDINFLTNNDLVKILH